MGNQLRSARVQRNLIIVVIGIAMLVVYFVNLCRGESPPIGYFVDTTVAEDGSCWIEPWKHITVETTWVYPVPVAISSVVFDSVLNVFWTVSVDPDTACVRRWGNHCGHLVKRKPGCDVVSDTWPRMACDCWYCFYCYVDFWPQFGRRPDEGPIIEAK